ncbi:serine protease [Saccharothrix obliqua]|uniref:serine protease n=1 Tax=Saccharothrix obliqua TaxID=2861747 RepID=UPI001C5F1700|nr:serine protease [Saccharothrix obliqua]MBW4721943.1 trypsin-like peptidase domain-containing protein [Saccharothrix obliqua]
MDPLTTSVVRLLRGDEPVGMGCLVGPRQVVTCAHVVARALDVPLGPVAPNRPLVLDFPLLAAGRPVRAAVVSWQPEQDVAGLVLEDVPDGAAPVRLVSPDALWGHEVRSFGVPHGHDAGVWATGVLRGGSASGLVQIDDERTSGFAVSPGFSGAPVWDDAADGVVGIVAQAEQRAARRTGYLIPASALDGAWPELRRLALVRPPFRGLEPFREEDADVFHGRSARVAELVAAVRRDGFAVLAGPSGSGKSSLALAGVVPVLRADGHRVVVVRPTSREDVAEAVGAEHRDGRLLLVVDQFDELRDDRPEDVLRDLRALADDGVVVLITVRSDVLGELTARPGVADLLNDRIALLGPPDAAGLREIIEAPLRAPAMPSYAPGLAERIAAETPAGSLALLQFVLTVLWERRRGGVLDHAAYDEVGGVTGAIADYAESVWQGLPDQDAARRLLGQLVSPAGAAGYVRRPLSSAELDPGLNAVVDALATTRLITVSGDGRGGRTVELAHEQLVHGWARLRAWADAEREFRAWQDDVHRHAARWRDSGREKALLPRGSALAEALRRTAEHPDLVLPGEAEYVAAGRRHRRTATLLRVGASALVLVVVAGSAVVWRRQVDDRREREAGELRTAAAETLEHGDEQARSLEERVLVDLRAAAVSEAPAVDRRLLDDHLGFQHATRLLELGDSPVDSWDVSANGTLVVRTDGITNRFTVHSLGLDHTDRTFDLGEGLVLANLVRFVDDHRVVVSAKRGLGGEDVVTVFDLERGAIARQFAPNPGELSQENPGAFDVDPGGRFLAFAGHGSTRVSVLSLDDPATRVELTADQPFRGDESGSRLAVVRGADSVLALGAKSADGLFPVFELTPRGRVDLPTLRDGAPVENSTGDVVLGGCVTEGAETRQVAVALAAGRVLAERVVHGSVCEPVAMGLDTSGRHLLGVFRTGSDRPDVLAAWRVDGSAPDRRFAVPAAFGGGKWTVRAGSFADDGSGHVVLKLNGTLLGLALPPTDSEGSAVAAAENAVLSPDGAALYVQATDGGVTAWDTRTGQRLGGLAAPAPRHPLDAFSPKELLLSDSGRRLLVSDRRDNADEHRNVVVVLETPTLRKLGELTLGNGLGEVHMALDGDDRLLTLLWRDGDPHLTRWDLTSMREQPAPVRLPVRMEGDEPVGVEHLFPDGDHVLVVESDGGVRRVRLDDGRDEPGSRFDVPHDLTRDASAAAYGDGLLALALSDRVELWDVAERGLVDTLPLTEPAAEIKITSGGDRVLVRTSGDVDVPDTLPADNGVDYGRTPGASLVTWSRGGLFGSDVTREPAADLVYRVVPAPAVVPRDRGLLREAVCRAVRSAELPEDRVAGLPEPARRVAACP